jgi:hypothetical protein
MKHSYFIFLIGAASGQADDIDLVTLDQLKITEDNRSIDPNVINQPPPGSDPDQPPDVLQGPNGIPSLQPVVEFKRSEDPELMRDKYGQVVTEQMRER